VGQLRVIGGERRGYRLRAPAGPRLRPTSDRVREALFDILSGRVEGARFLDLYAGSGAVGIESLSRGALECVLVESDRLAVRAIRRNLEVCGYVSRARVIRALLPEALGRLEAPRSFDLVFVDPPYGDAGAGAVLERLARGDLLAPGAEVVLEHDRRDPAPDPRALTKFRSVRHGDTVLSFYRARAAGGSGGV
jgi:16S rRNA (guanine(966)-N(2))-methyltransferase RsmD